MLYKIKYKDQYHFIYHALKEHLQRIFAAILVGAALSVAGATFQGIFRNPLVSPDLLGVSSGACIGAAMAILLGRG